MENSEGWDVLEDRDFWKRVALPWALVAARLGGVLAKRWEADRAVSFFTKATWAVIGAQVVISAESDYLARQEKRRRAAGSAA